MANNYLTTESKKLATWYFTFAAIIFGAQLLFGLVAAIQYVMPGFLFEIVDFSVARMIHINALVVWMVFAMFGSVLLVNLLDPYSNFGKIVSNLLRPVYYTINNVGVFFLEKFDIYTLYRVEPKSYNFYSIGFSAAFMGLVGFLSWKHGRLYCNTVCPAGTVLGITSKISIFKIQLNDSLCTSCGVCGAPGLDRCFPGAGTRALGDAIGLRTPRRKGPGTDPRLDLGSGIRGRLPGRGWDRTRGRTQEEKPDGRNK